MPPKPVKVVADRMLDVRAQLCANEAIACELVEYDGREISRGYLVDADALLVRSVTNVNQALLEHTAIKFVGSATIGYNHVDLDWLQQHSIEFVHAPGCNANAVVDYVMSVLLDYFGAEALQGRAIGIVGYGNVGSRLARCLTHFGVACRVYDPLVEVPRSLAVSSLNEILCCDAISIHVPLTQHDRYPTHHMLAETELSKVKSGALLVNASRGEVLDSKALKYHLLKDSGFSVALDVWENEPEIDIQLLGQAQYCTGHIAGYSQLGKQRGSSTVVQAMMNYFSVSNEKTSEKSNKITKVYVEPESFSTPVAKLTQFEDLNDYAQVLAAVIDPAAESQKFRSALGLASDKKGKSSNIAERFDRYRKEYQLRNEIEYSP